jgi:hypothetical protein
MTVMGLSFLKQQLVVASWPSWRPSFDDEAQDDWTV